MSKLEDKWSQIAEKTQRASRLMGSKTWETVRVKSSGTHVKLKPGYQRLILVLFCFGMGLLFIICISIRVKDGLFWRILCIGMALFPGLGMLHILPYVKSISWDIAGVNLKIVYGFLIFRKSLFVRSDSVKVSLDTCKREVHHTNVRKGSSVLSLKRTDKSGQDLIIAIGIKQSSLSKAFEKLNEFLKIKGEDRTLVIVELVGGKRIIIPKTAVAESRHTGGENIKLYLHTNENVIFKRNWQALFWLVIGIAIGTFFIILPFTLAKNENWKVIETVGSVLFGCLFLGWGLLGVWQFFHTRYTVMSKVNNTLSLNASADVLGGGKLVCSLSNIVALQLCRYGSYLPTGKSTIDIAIFELNAVLKEPMGKRVNILRSENEQQIRQDARVLSEFLRVIVIDHTYEHS